MWQRLSHPTIARRIFLSRERPQLGNDEIPVQPHTALKEGSLVGRIRFYFAASLDGYIADANGNVGFLDAFGHDAGAYDAFFSGIGTLVIGRETYKFVEDYGSWPYGNARKIVVLTHRPIEHPLCDLQTRVVDDVSAFARELRALPEGDTWIVGGGKVMGAFLAAGEVDVIEMAVVPVAIGGGIPMYAGCGTTAHRFDLLELSRRPNGIVRSVYERTVSELSN
jgi:dihydrofolate reductase